MSYFFIGIGGTGAKCLEAAIHLCAAGFMPDDRNLCAFFIDPDESNAMMDRARHALDLYRKCAVFAFPGGEMFKTKISTPRDIDENLGLHWSPRIPGKPTLNDAFGYASLAAHRDTEDMAALIDVLYGEDEKSMSLDKGFRGRPSIGAALFAHRMENADDFWNQMYAEIGRRIEAGDTRIILAGSVFGGTGAAGLPTVGRKLYERFHEKKEHFNLGALLILPYFTYTSSLDTMEVSAKSEGFLLNSQMALHYYDHEQFARYFSQINPLGDNAMSEVGKFSIGGGDQNNDPHIVELYAALAAMEFFGMKKPDGKVPIIARQNDDELDWNDLAGMPGTRARLGQFIRFAFGYTRLFYPALDRFRDSSKAGRGAPWYIQMFQRRGIRLTDDEVWQQLTDLNEYCGLYLSWVHGIHASRAGLAMDTVSKDAIESTRARQFDGLLLPSDKDDRYGLKRAWEQLSEMKIPEGEGESGVARFVRALYAICGTEE